MRFPNKRQWLQFITGLGAILAGLGTLPIDSAQLPLPPEWRPYLISIGFFAITARQWLGIIADLLDDGQLNKSTDFDLK